MGVRWDFQLKTQLESTAESPTIETPKFGFHRNSNLKFGLVDGARNFKYFLLITESSRCL